MALLRGLAASAPPVLADRGLLARRAAVVILYAALRETESAPQGEIIEHLVAADLQGHRKGLTLLSWRFDGRINLPNTDEDISACQAATAQALATNTFDPINVLAPNCLDISDGEILPAAPLGIAIDKVILSVICQMGGTKNIGKAPPGALIHKLKDARKT